MEAPHVESAAVTTSAATRTDDDYTGLPAWYLRQLIYPAIAGRAAHDHVTIGEAMARMTREQISDEDEVYRMRSHFNYLANGKIKLVGLRTCERLLTICGMRVTDAADEMWVPLWGIRPAVRMAGDELFAANLPLDRDALLARAEELRQRRDALLEQEVWHGAV